MCAKSLVTASGNTVDSVTRFVTPSTTWNSTGLTFPCTDSLVVPFVPMGPVRFSVTGRMRSGLLEGHAPSRKSASFRKNTFWHPSENASGGSASVPTVTGTRFVSV